MVGLKERIRSSRAEAGLSTEDVAAKIRVTRQAYTNYEAGRRVPDVDTIASLAQLFNVSSDFLLGLCESQNQQLRSDAQLECVQTLSDEERGLLERFRLLDADGKTVVKHAALMESRRLGEQSGDTAVS